MVSALALSLLLYALAIVSTVLYSVLSWRRNYWLRNGVPHSPSVKALNLGALSGCGISKCNTIKLLQVTYKQYLEHCIPFCGVGFRRRWQPVALIIDGRSQVDEIFSRGAAKASLDNYWLQLHFFLPIGAATKAEERFTADYAAGDQVTKFVPQLWHKAQLLIGSITSARKDDDTLELVELQQICARYIVDVTAECLFNVKHCDSLGQPSAELESVYALIWQLFREHKQHDSGWRHWLPSKWQQYWHEHQLRMSVFTFCTQQLIKVTSDGRRPGGLIGFLLELNTTTTSGDRAAVLLNIDEATIKATTNVFLYFLHALSHSLADMTLTLYELARHPKTQEELYAEIVANKEQKNNFKLLADRECLEHILCETQRAYCTLPCWLVRTLESDVSICKQYSLKKGTLLLHSNHFLGHYDHLFPQPELWDASRFAVIENMDSLNRAIRRYCGQNEETDLAELQTSIGLMSLVEHFKFSLCDQKSLAYDNTMPIVSLTTGPQLKLQRRL